MSLWWLNMGGAGRLPRQRIGECRDALAYSVMVTLPQPATRRNQDVCAESENG